MRQPNSAPQKATIHDVAARAGASIAKLSLALGGRGRMMAATRKRVLRVTEGLIDHGVPVPLCAAEG